MTELQELVAMEAELTERSTRLFNEEWIPKFQKTMTRKEFSKVHADLQEAAHNYLGSGLPGMMEILVIFESDALRVRTGVYKDKEVTNE